MSSADDQWNKSALLALATQYAAPQPAQRYGTAGFRTKAALLPGVMLRVGVLAALRSMQLGKATGVMITASHNPEPDNGAKMVDPDGGMLSAEWEELATRFANANANDLVHEVDAAIERLGLSMRPAVVFVGRDNRPHSHELATRVIEGVQALRGALVQLGVVTTPQLHWAVRQWNLGRKHTPAAYIAELFDAFTGTLASVAPSSAAAGSDAPAKRAHAAAAKLPKRIVVDAANGAGGQLMSKLAPLLSSIVPFEVRNANPAGVINDGCGSEHVQKLKHAPAGFSIADCADALCVSIDGDCDRVVFFYFDGDGQFQLLDGDKLASLLAAYVGDLLSTAGLKSSVHIGVVQTAYANGASTAYLEKQKIATVCAPTGVKYVHHEALHFDVGIYFEANGHGAVLLSEHMQAAVAEAVKSTSADASASVRGALHQLSMLPTLSNQAVGDAASDMLMVLAALAHFGWSAAKWNGMYADLPSRQSVLRVADRTVVRTTNAERQVTHPEGLQAAIDALVAKYPSGRSFVRPSGTEDVVRVYAETDTQAHTDELALSVMQLVHKMAGGVGDAPSRV